MLFRSPITAFLVAAVAFANAPAIGQKVAAMANNTELGRRGGDFLAGMRRSYESPFDPKNLKDNPLNLLSTVAGIAGFVAGPTVTNNNNITVNGVQDAGTFGREAGSAINNATVDSYKNVQQNQGTGLR